MACLWTNVLVKLIAEGVPKHPKRQIYAFQGVPEAKSAEVLVKCERQSDDGQNDQF